MHGLIFTSLRDYLTSEHGADLALEIFAEQPMFLVSESYEDETFVALIGSAASRLGRDVDDVVHDFGVYTAETTFTRLYPAFFSISPSTRDFLLTVETRIHELVRATIPHAEPPQLRVEDHGPATVGIVYSSPRRLCVLLRGLVQGTARYYGEEAAIEERSCMHRGDPACTFEITLSGGQTA